MHLKLRLRNGVFGISNGWVDLLLSHGDSFRVMMYNGTLISVIVLFGLILKLNLCSISLHKLIGKHQLSKCRRVLSKTSHMLTVRVDRGGFKQQRRRIHEFFMPKKWALGYKKKSCSVWWTSQIRRSLHVTLAKSIYTGHVPGQSFPLPPRDQCSSVWTHQRIVPKQSSWFQNGRSLT